MKQKKKNRWKRLLSAGLAAVMAAGCLAGCGDSADQGNSDKAGSGTVSGNGNENPDSGSGREAGTIKILFFGPKTEGFDMVYEQYLAETKDTLNTQLDITWVEHADYQEKLNLEMTSGGRL